MPPTCRHRDLVHVSRRKNRFHAERVLNDSATENRRHYAEKMKNVSRRKNRFTPITAATATFRNEKLPRKNAETKRRNRKLPRKNRPEKNRRKPFHADTLYFYTGFPQSRTSRFSDFFCIFTGGIYRSRN